MTNQAAQTMPELPPSFARVHDDGYWTLRVRDTAEFIVHDSRQTPAQEVYSSDQMRDMYQQGYAAALSKTAWVAEPGRYFAGGPQGHFFADDLQLARDLVNLYDKDDDWTITDLRNPTGAAPAASGGEVWTREMIADVHKRGEELFQRINPPAAASVSERERLLLAAACDSVGLYETADGLRANLKGLDLLGIRSKLLAIEQALTQQRGETVAHASGVSGSITDSLVSSVEAAMHACYMDHDDYRITTTLLHDMAIAAVNAVATTHQPSADAVRDGIRMDWLVSKAVEVRDPLRHGSRAMFHAQTASDEDEPHRTTLREQIDAAMADELESLLSGGSHA